MRLMAIASLVLCCVALTGGAQELAQFDRILLPLYPSRVAGALGSDWVTELSLTNLSARPLRVFGYQQTCPVTTCGADPLSPRTTILVKCEGCRTTGPSLLRVEPGRSSDLGTSLRVRDVSRATETWGTTIPVVSEEDFLSARFTLNDIPVGTGFRVMIRIFDVDPSSPPAVRVRVYATDPQLGKPPGPEDRLIAELTPEFQSVFSATAFALAYATMPLLVESQAPGRVRVEIEPLDARREYWGFATVTHNITQHVTSISPR